MLGYANNSQIAQGKFNRQINEVRKYWQTHTSEGFKDADTKLKKIEKNLLAKLHQFNHANGILEDKVLELRSHYVHLRRDLQS